MEKDIQIVPSGNELEKQFEFINSLIEQHRSSAISLMNNEAIQMYWDIGQYISSQLKSAHWGTKVVSDLADYLKRQNPKRRGFSKRNLYNMVKFYDTYSRPLFIDRISQLNISEIVPDCTNERKCNCAVGNCTIRIPSHSTNSLIADIHNLYQSC